MMENRLLQAKWGGWLAVALCVAAGPAQALEARTNMSGLCTKYFARAEREYGIPKHLILSISATESGRWNDEAKMTLPWPWTINANGEGKYFETKHDAVIATRNLLAQGVKQIDVGCMQINLQHHPDAFASVGEAFDPESNVMYGAKFLKSNYDDLGSWQKAIAAYHSRTPSLGSQYFAQVKQRWKNVLAAIGTERNPYVHKVGEGFDLATLTEESEGMSDSLRAVLQKNKANASKRKAERMSRRMKIIKVTEVASVEDSSPEILVVRPTANENYQSPNVVVRQDQQVPDELKSSGNAKSIKIVETGDDGPVATEKSSSRKTGPNFVFY